MNKYFKNFILCGDIDHHCLLCKESFQTLEDLEKHIRWEKHRKIMKNVTCIPKFKKDSIYKIDDSCYCEYCNCVISTAEALSHVEEPKHKENKTNPPSEARGTICKREAGVIVIETIKITNKEWNGLVDSKCLFCDEPVDNFVKHISMSSHMINMIKSEICKSDGDQYYRKINKEKYYCFMCKKTFESTSVMDHWNDSYHIEKTKVKNADSNSSSRSNLDKNLDIAVRLINSQKDFFDIDLDNKVATCKICTAYVNINFQFMIEHKKTHNIKSKDQIEPVHVDMDEVIESLKSKKNDANEHQLYIFDHGKRRAELAKYGRNNFIKLLPPGGKGYCSLCNIYISAHMNNFTGHVSGQIHMGHLELKGLDKSVKPHTKPSYKTRMLKDYLKSVIHAEELKVLWINKQYCVDIFSFMLVAIIDESVEKKQVKCYACDITYDHEKESNHCQTEKHKQVFLNSDVITTIKDEFVREIRPNLFHCATCNLTFPFWETLDKHLVSWKHVFTKNDKSVMTKLTEQWYTGSTVPHLNQEKVYTHLLRLGIL